MMSNKTRWWLRVSMIVLPLIFLGGCIDYTIETTLNADGSGIREERMEVSDEDDSEFTRDEFAELMSITPQSGWAHHTELDDDGDTVHVFQRSTQVADLASWSDLNDDVTISGSLRSLDRSVVGYVSLDGVRFRNTVRVGIGQVSDGSSSYTYREIFRWDDALDALVESVVEVIEASFERQYPELSVRERGEVVGFVRARLWDAIDKGILDADDEEEEALTMEIVDRSTEHAVRIMRARYPGLNEEPVRGLLNEIFEDDTQILDDFLNETVPGIQLAWNTNLVFRLNMPGRVTDSNAHDTDGSTLVWEFSPADCIQAPVEIVAESALRRDAVVGSPATR